MSKLDGWVYRLDLVCLREFLLNQVLDFENEFHEFSQSLDADILEDDNEGSEEDVICDSVEGVSGYNTLPYVVGKGLWCLDKEGLKLWML